MIDSTSLQSIRVYTCNTTLLIKALTEGVNRSLVPWKYQRTIPPLLKIVNKSNIMFNLTNVTCQLKSVSCILLSK